MTRIHATAIVDPKACIDESVVIGPYTIIGPNVTIAANTEIGAHTVVEGHTTIGQDNKIASFCSIGVIPQDKKYDKEPTRLEIGDRNTIREYTSIHIGTAQDGGLTSIGNDNWLMSYIHIAHDCHIANNTILANSTQLAGHVHIGDYAVLGGFTLIHQFVKVGAHCMTAINSVLFQDVPPYVMVGGTPTKPYGINIEGLKRRGFTSSQITELKRAYKVLYRQGLSLHDAQAKIFEMTQATDAVNVPVLDKLSLFLTQVSRGLVR